MHASLSFLVTLLDFSELLFTASAEFIAVMQILVYAGAILVIFMFVIVLFQDAHQQIYKTEPKSSLFLLIFASSRFNWNYRPIRQATDRFADMPIKIYRQILGLFKDWAERFTLIFSFLSKR